MMDTFDLTGRRLRAQSMEEPLPDANRAVARILALQAQDRPAALWAIGLRAGATLGEVEDAAASGRIVRTWLMRGTLHFTTPGDVGWLLDLLAPKIIAGSRRRDQQLRLDDEAYARSRAILSEALEGRALSRSGAMGVLERAGVSTAGQRGYHIFRRLALEKLICFGPMLGKEPSFVLLDPGMPDAPALSREEALAELARRYFAGHGPAGLDDLVWWSGITRSEARRAIEAVGQELVKETVNGSECWSAPVSAQKEVHPKAHLLPAFDEYIIGYRDRGQVLDADHNKKVLSSNGIFYPTVLIDGKVRGTWRAKRRKGSIDLEAAMFSALTRDEEASLEEAGARYSRFIGLPAALTTRTPEHGRSKKDSIA